VHDNKISLHLATSPLGILCIGRDRFWAKISRRSLSSHRMNTTGKALHQFNLLPETGFGIRLLGSKTWVQFVLEAAINDLARLINSPKPSGCQIMFAVGCGQDKSFKFLKSAFNKSAHLDRHFFIRGGAATTWACSTSLESRRGPRSASGTKPC
jgi:hypothetical protein